LEMSKGYRKIIVHCAEYEWRVGRTHVDIRFWGEDPFYRMTPTIEEVTGLTSDEVDRARRKRYLSVTPQQIRDFIREYG
jgi:hypothetical protein